MLLENLSDCDIELDDLVCNSDKYLFSNIDHLVFIDIKLLLFSIAFFDPGRLFIRVFGFRVFDVVLNLRVRTVLVFAVTVALDLLNHLWTLVSFHLLVVTTLRSLLLLLQRIVKHSYEHLILHAIHSVAS